MSQIKVWLGKPYPLGATWRGNGINFALYWSSDRAPDRPLHDTVVYEVHVKGFSKLCPHIPEKIRGSYAGLGSSWAIDYLTNLGITAVELMPVHQFVDDKISQRPGRSESKKLGNSADDKETGTLVRSRS